MDQAQFSAAWAMEMITPKEFEDLFKDSATLELVGIKNYEPRRSIFNAVKTSQVL